MKRVLKVILLAVVLVVGALAAWGFVAHEGRPADGEAGAAADALARSIRAATGGDGWARTGAVSWTFAGRQTHLWDRQRNLARVQWKSHDVLVDLSTRQGVAQSDGAVVSGAEGQALVAQAYAHWTNDAFWLDPFRTFFQEGVERSITQDAKGREGLLIRFGSGGVTPGDAYLWFVDADGLPVEYRMWVSIIPIGGLGATWDGWADLPTGAKVSTTHTLGGFLPLELQDVRAAATLAELLGAELLGAERVGEADPFAALVGAGDAPASQPGG